MERLDDGRSMSNASRVRIEVIDPRDVDARLCLRSYFEELNRRCDTGFDPAQSISASDDEMTLPNGLLLVANLLGAPVGSDTSN